jgi:hypothetical protein
MTNIEKVVKEKIEPHTEMWKNKCLEGPDCGQEM